MRRFMVTMLTLGLCLVLTIPAFGEMDFSGYSFDELLGLQDELNLEIASRDEANSILIPEDAQRIGPGAWIVGDFLPAGTYELYTKEPLGGYELYPSYEEQERKDLIAIDLVRREFNYSPTTVRLDEGLCFVVQGGAGNWALYLRKVTPLTFD